MGASHRTFQQWIQRTTRAVAVGDTANTEILVFDVQFVDRIRLYSETLTTVTGTPVLRLEISPQAITPTGGPTSWIAAGLTVSPTGTVGDIVIDSVGVAAEPLRLRARSARLVVTTAQTAGTYQVTAVGF